MKKLRFISTPLWVYILVATGSIFLIFLPLIATYCCSSQFSTCLNILSNIGYGLTASLVFAILEDLGNTASKKKEEKKNCEMAKSELKNECDSLLSEVYVSAYDCFGTNEDKKLTFGNWIRKLFLAECVEKGKQNIQIQYFLQCIASIKKSAESLRACIKTPYFNVLFPEKFKQDLYALISICERIQRNASKKEVCAKIITGEFVERIVSLFPELEEEYTKEYDERDHAI